MLTTTIAGTSWPCMPNSHQVTDNIGQRSVASFTVLDTAGVGHFTVGQPVTLQDDNGNVFYAGIVTDAIRGTQSSYSNLLLHMVTCSDWHWLADKRVYATSYANQTCGFMVNDLVTNVLAAEGVIVTRGINLYSLQVSDPTASDLSGFTSHAFGASGYMAIDMSNPWHLGALKAVFDGTGTHQFINAHILAASYQVSKAYITSCYIKGDAASAGKTVGVAIDSSLGVLTAYTNVTLTTSWQRVVSPAFTTANPVAQTWLGWRIDTGAVAQAVTCWVGGIQMEQAAAASSWEPGGYPVSVQAGPQVISYVINYKYLSTVLDELSTLAGYYWLIDAEKVLWFAAQATNLAPWTFDGTQALEGATIEDTSPLYRDAQWVLGGKEVTAPQTEVQKGDGSKRVFGTSYPIHSVPTNIHVNAGAAQTIGILGVDTGKQWYWNKGVAQFTQDNSGTLLVSTDTVSITYVGEYQVIAYNTDSVQVGIEQAIEGAGSGIVENVIADSSIITAAQAFQTGAALLGKYAKPGQILTFTTMVPGLKVGQLLQVNLPAPWSLTGQQLLIQTITITYDDFNLWYSVQALLGPVNQTWVQFYQALASVQTPIDLAATGGVQTTVAILAAFTMIWTWAITFTATVQVCPVFPLTFTATMC